MLTKDRLQELRTPKAAQRFCKAVVAYSLSKQVESYKSKKRSGLYSKFWGEFFPFQVYFNRLYKGRSDVRGRVILGNQWFDAEIINGRGELLERLEFTNPIDWWWYDAQIRTMVDTGKKSNPKIKRLISKRIEIVFRTALKKSTRDYEGATLIFCIDNQDDSKNQIIKTLKKYIKKLSFKADAVAIACYPHKNTKGGHIQFVL